MLVEEIGVLEIRGQIGNQRGGNRVEMAIQAHSERDLGLSMEIATDAVDPEPCFILIVHLGEPCGHVMVRMDFDQTGLVRGTVVEIAWLDGHSGTELVGDGEVPFRVIGEVEEALKGTVRAVPVRSGISQHVGQQGGGNAGHEGRDLGFEVWEPFNLVCGDGKEDLQLVAVSSQKKAVSSQNHFIERVGGRGQGVCGHEMCDERRGVSH